MFDFEPKEWLSLWLFMFAFGAFWLGWSAEEHQWITFFPMFLPMAISLRYVFYNIETLEHDGYKSGVAATIELQNEMVRI